jgi:hypothetical protein
MRKIIGRIYGQYTPSGKFWLTVGLIALVVDVAIGFIAGKAVATFWHGMGFAALAAGFAFLPDAAYEEFEHKRYASGVVMALICIPLGVKAYEQQLTYSTGMRHGEIQLTNVVNTRYDGAQDDVKRNQAELAILMGALKRAQEDANWAGTVTADGLRQQVATIDKAIAAESSKANGGCKRRCIELMAKKDDAEKKIAAAEKVETTEARVKELQAAIDAKRATANTAEHRQSINADIAMTTAKLWNIVSGATPEDAIKVNEVSMQFATLGSAGLGSLALLLLAPVGMFLANRRRIKQDGHDDPSAPAPITDINPPRETPIPSRLHTKEIVRTDAGVWNDMRLALEGYRRAPAH